MQIGGFLVDHCSQSKGVDIKEYCEFFNSSVDVYSAISQQYTSVTLNNFFILSLFKVFIVSNQLALQLNFPVKILNLKFHRW